MVEATENIDLVTMRRQSDLEASQREYQARLDSAASQPAAAEPEVLTVGAPTVETAPAQPTPDATAVSPLASLRLSVVAIFLLALLFVCCRHRRQ